MVSFPIFSQVDVNGYALYPGPSLGQAGLHIALKPGLTLVVGANGLGKTTLITLLFRMLTGAFDIPNLDGREELGSLRLNAMPITASIRNTFMNRVADRASNATCKLLFNLDKHEIILTRRLTDLVITGLSVDGIDQRPDDSKYQELIIQMAGVGSFGDFILMLRFLVFYFEDRRALVWDPSAQRQILRMLFLSPETAQSWTGKERAILELDTRMRNLQASVNREERSYSDNVVRAQGGAAVRRQLKALEDMQGADRERLARLDDQTLEIDALRQKAVHSFLQAEQDREGKFRAVEHAKLAAIDARFPGRSESGKYIVAHLMSELECLVCGTRAPAAAAAYTARLEAQKCVICESDLSKSERVVGAAEVADKRIKQTSASFAAAEKNLAGARAELESAEAAHRDHTALTAELGAKIAERSVEIDALVRALPKSEVVIREQRDALSSLRRSVEAMKVQLAEMRSGFQEFIESMSQIVVASSVVIEEAFAEYATGFLAEEATISRTSYRAPVGQTGEAIAFPAYRLDMTGSDFGDKVRRAGPDDVSESQREFIDLAFRIALIKAAGTRGAGSLIIDAPESSLDAVFARQAAEILVRFGEDSGQNRVMLTSNLVEGSLIPTLMAAVNATAERQFRLVDLFDIARPTAAIIRDHVRYDEARRRLLGSSE